MTLTGSTTLGQSGPGNKGNEGKFIRVCVSYTGTSFWEDLTPIDRDTVSVSRASPTGLLLFGISSVRTCPGQTDSMDTRYVLKSHWLVGWLVGISTFVDYLTPNPFLCKYFYFKQFSLA